MPSVITQEIVPDQVDAKSPIDEQLMEAIRQDLYDLDAAIAAAGAFDYQFKLNGYLKPLTPDGVAFVPRRRIDGSMISKATTFTSCRAVLEQPGSSGTLEVDVRRYTRPNVALAGLEYLYSEAISSIGRVGSSLSTQSIARTTSQISTQSISAWKTQLSIQSITPLPNTNNIFDDEAYTDLVVVSLNGTVDSDWVADSDSVILAGCDDAANDGTFVIRATNVGGGNNVLISNASAVLQAGSNGTCDLGAWKLEFVNPVNSEFTAGEVATLASHTDPLNNGARTIYAINQGGNNIIIKSATMVAQGGAAGNANANRWKYALSSAASATDYVVGENALMASHSSGVNDGSFPITAVNSGGNNICVYNASGAAQGGAAGTIDTQRWTYVLPTDPSSEVSVGHKIWTQTTTADGNKGEFVVKEVNRAAGNNLVVYNTAGVTQGGSVGTIQTSRVKVKFAASQASYITTSSRVALYGLPPKALTVASPLDDEYDVLEVNRGGGANYNVVVNMYLAVEAGACGRLTLESKSLFDTRPSISVTDMAGNWGSVSSNAVLNATQASIPANTLVMLDLLQIPRGAAKNLTVQLL